MTKQEAYKRYEAADAAWSAELRLAFGKNAGDVRYTKQGEGEPGTPLNDAYLAYREARDEWRARA